MISSSFALSKKPDPTIRMLILHPPGMHFGQQFVVGCLSLFYWGNSACISRYRFHVDMYVVCVYDTVMI